MATTEQVLYEKCIHCHLFVEDNDDPCQHSGTRVHEYVAGECVFCKTPQLARYVHLHRGNDVDEAIDESHEAQPSGLVATLDTWRIFGPSAMRERFITRP